MFCAVFLSIQNLEFGPINKQSEKCRRKNPWIKAFAAHSDPHKQGLKAYCVLRGVAIVLQIQKQTFYTYMMRQTT